jgi:hypothetical protein
MKESGRVVEHFMEIIWHMRWIKSLWVIKICCLSWQRCFVSWEVQSKSLNRLLIFGCKAFFWCNSWSLEDQEEAIMNFSCYCCQKILWSFTAVLDRSWIMAPVWRYCLVEVALRCFLVVPAWGGYFVVDWTRVLVCWYNCCCSVLKDCPKVCWVSCFVRTW